MIAFFQESGTKPTDNNWLYNKASGLAREYLTFLKNRGGRLSGPEERLGFSLLIAAITLASPKVIVSSTSTILRVWLAGMWPFKVFYLQQLNCDLFKMLAITTDVSVSLLGHKTIFLWTSFFLGKLVDAYMRLVRPAGGAHGCCGYTSASQLRSQVGTKFNVVVSCR